MAERAASYWDNGHPRICAREHPNASALCGAPAYSTMWTNARRSYVTCRACLAEIELRLAMRASAGEVRRRPAL